MKKSKTTYLERRGTNLHKISQNKKSYNNFYLKKIQGKT